MSSKIFIHRFADDTPALEAVNTLAKLVREKYPERKETLPVEKITYGDPDGQGELRSTKEYALRVVLL